MRLRYGNYLHDHGEVAVSISRQNLETDAGVPYECVHTWQVSGRVVADTTAGLVGKLLRLERAYAIPFQAAALVDANGLVCHALPNAGSVSGVRVVQPPSYPDGSGAQLTTYRDYTVVLSAAYPVFARPLLRLWTETVTLWGGLPDRRVVATVNTAPLVYVARRRTPYYATQVGQAVGYSTWPAPPPPLFPAALDGPEHPRSQTSPRTQEGRLTDFAVGWSYRFSSPLPLVGRPAVMPGG